MFPGLCLVWDDRPLCCLKAAGLDTLQWILELHRGRGRCPIHSPMTGTAMVEPGQCQEPHSVFPHRWLGPKYLGHLLLLFSGYLQEDGLEVVQPGHELALIRNAGLTGGNFTHCATTWSNAFHIIENMQCNNNHEFWQS